jgi:Transposase DDE domain
MIILTYLPAFITIVFRDMPGVWKSQHRLLLCWVVVMHALYPGRKTLEEVARWSPQAITAWRLRRLLKASYWCVHVLITWLASDVIRTLPPPEDGILFEIGDGSHVPKRGAKNPTAQKGRKSKYHPWFFGIRFVLLIVAWDVYRIPVAFRIILPKTHPDYRTENALFREMLEQFQPPAWAKQVIVLGDAGYGSKANIKLVKQLDKIDRSRSWHFVFAISRTWKTVDDKAVKDLVTYLPRCHYKRTWVPRITHPDKRKTYWTYRKHLSLRDIGDVTLVLSKKGRNVGPKNTKLLVTNLPDATARQVISLYQNRWSIELINRNLKSDLGLGQHQVRGEVDRMERSFGISVLAFLFILRMCHHEIIPGKPWSLAQLQHGLRLRVITNQVAHNVKATWGRGRKVA